MNLDNYAKILVQWSGGKDSLSCVLELLRRGVPPEKIELWHQAIDGRNGPAYMDWPVTESYCKVVADALGIPIYYQWRVGGFKAELFKEEDRSNPVRFERPDGTIGQAGGTRGKIATRRKFPQMSADLSVRWCSSNLKIDVAALAIRNQDRFLDQKTLVVTGERAEESAARKNYAVFEVDRADNRGGKYVDRWVDHWRPVHGWPEERVWQIIRDYGIVPHPAYLLGWGRLSCMACIFGSDNQWASLRRIAEARFQEIAAHEAEFGVTIHRTKSVEERADAGDPYDAIAEELVALALADEYTGEVITANWTLPAGAFGENAGPI